MPADHIERAESARSVEASDGDGPVRKDFVAHNRTMSSDRTAEPSEAYRVCFVSTGNIRRSPVACAVLTSLVAAAGRTAQVSVSSAGTGDWHVGEGPDPGLHSVLHRHDFDADAHHARHFDPDELPSLDLVVVFDRSQERIVKAWASSEVDRAKIRLLHAFDPDQAHLGDLPDLHTAGAPFESVVDRIERACAALLGSIERGLPPRD